MRPLPAVLALHSDGPQSLISGPEKAVGRAAKQPEPSSDSQHESHTRPTHTWVRTITSAPTQEGRAGMIDGLNNVTAFVRLVLPSNLGAVVAVVVFATVLSWSEVLFASVLTTDETQTLAIGLSSIVAQPTSPIRWNYIMASSILASVPIVIAFALVQKRFVQGLSTGAVKG